ncbi:hypothetical protein WOLCODRAFT_90848 [Wolfiporia cocos MD-104 SS10]|uniref:GATA-type domain-containing protein n=1 Tax=Wolfiporia cocos (strain MD-104) TaxID=742152 RepID=A0A2H3JSJ0_WOLCO|nr:hypothetical protein WOLCODRAFT_90848 [Wolfiporia cocos MD-104 SS10]
MASDGRYAYQHPQEVNPPYGYPPYSAPPYEHQFAPNMPRPARSTSSQAHSPHPPPPAPYSAPPSSYPPPPAQYPPPGYPVPAPAPGSWPADGWAQYPPTYPPPPPPHGQEPHYAQNGARADGPPPEHRAYPPGPSRPDPHRADERPRADGAAAPPTRKTRDSEPPPPPPKSPRSPVPALDYKKLAEQYGFLAETAASMTHNPLPSRTLLSPETLERLFQAATFGVQLLESASKRAVHADVKQQPSERTPEEVEPAPAQQRQPENPPGAEGQTCLGCNATSTPEWRRGPMGPRTLCNACGLVYAKLIKKRNRDPARARGAYPAFRQDGQAAHALHNDSAPASSGEGGSDDEDSYGSQDRRSDGGFHGGRD